MSLWEAGRLVTEAWMAVVLAAVQPGPHVWGTNGPWSVQATILCSFLNLGLFYLLNLKDYRKRELEALKKGNNVLNVYTFADDKIKNS